MMKKYLLRFFFILLLLKTFTAFTGPKEEFDELWAKCPQPMIEIPFADSVEIDGIIDKKETRTTLPGHHPPLNREKSCQGPAKEELLLLGKNEDLDRYVKNLKQRSRGRGVLNLRRLLNLQRTYPQGPFMAGISKALAYGLYDLARLQKIILDNIAGDFFDLS